MTTQVQIPQETVEQAVERILASGRITRAHQQVFMRALMSENSLSDIEQVLINKVLDKLQRGFLRVDD